MKQKSVFVFPFLCFIVHKRKNDKREVIFRFSVFCVSSFEKTKNDKTEVKVCLSFFGKI